MFSWVVSFINSTGVFAVALLMFGENVFPPIPSELIMPLAGFAAARGDMNFFMVLIAGSIGSIAGALLWYYVGVWIGAERLKRWAAKHGRWLTLTPQEVDKADEWFDKHGGKAVLLGRLVPAVRTLISVPAGISGMKLVPFLIYTSIGTVIWTGFLAGAGLLLESQYENVSQWTGPVSNAIVAGLLIYYLYRVATFRRKVAKPDAQ